MSPWNRELGRLILCDLGAGDVRGGVPGAGGVEGGSGSAVTTGDGKEAGVGESGCSSATSIYSCCVERDGD